MQHILFDPISARLEAATRGGRSFFAVWLLAVLASCAATSASLPPTPSNGDLKGIASWYGLPYHGRKTANGERYNMEALTAAHRTLPFQSRVRVVRLDSGSSVEVRINDRGPFVKGRVIDLSRAAARRLGILKMGVAPVRLAPFSVPPEKPSSWIVLVGGFANAEEARRFVRRMGEGFPRTRLVRGWHGDPRFYRVRLEGLSRRERASNAATRLQREGYNAFLVRSR